METGHLSNRIHIILYGCLLWACMTWLFGLTRWVPYPLVMGYIAWSLNGLGLSLVIPNTQSIVADYYTSESRGTAFGFLFFLSSVGAIVGSVYAINIAGVRFGDVQGWQLVMFTLAVVSAGVGVVNVLIAKDPRYVPGFQVESSRPKEGWKDAWKEIGSVIRVPTFMIIILQGVVGTMPWKVMAAYTTLYLQLVGMSDAQTSAIQTGFLIGTAFGALLGGFLGDKAAQASPNHGRILVCQFSVLMGIPMCILNYTILPRNGEQATMVFYILMFLLQGLIISWAAPSCNTPIFAEIVPQRRRNLIYAFDRCFEDAVASPVTYFVGWAASSIFGFKGNATTTGNQEIDLQKADALAKAIVWFSIIPFILCVVFYSGLHWTYRKDKTFATYGTLSSETLSSDAELEMRKETL